MSTINQKFKQEQSQRENEKILPTNNNLVSESAQQDHTKIITDKIVKQNGNVIAIEHSEKHF